MDAVEACSAKDEAAQWVTAADYHIQSPRRACRYCLWPAKGTPETEEARSWAMGGQCVAVFIRIEQQQIFQQQTVTGREVRSLATHSVVPKSHSFIY